MRLGTLWAAALVLVAGVGTAAAEDGHPTWYAGVGAGSYQIKYVDIILPSEPPQVGSTSKDGDDLTKVFIGFKPIQYFALEVGVMSGGRFSDTVGSFTVGSDYSGYDISALGILPLAERRFEIYGRLGVARNELNISVADSVDPVFSGNYRERLKQSYRLYGAGVQVNLGSRKNYGIGLEYNYGDTSRRLDEYSETLLRFTLGWGGKD